MKKHVADKISSIDSVKGFVEVYHSMYSYFKMQNNEYQGFRFDGQYLYTNLLGSVHFRQYTEWRGKVKDNSVKGLPIDQLNNIYLKSKDENAVTFNRRIRAKLATDKSIYVISARSTSVTAADGSVQQLKFEIAPTKAITDLQATLGKFHDFHAISFVVPPRQPQARKAQKLASQQNIHYLQGYGRDTKVETVSQMSTTGKTYVYIPLQEWQDKRESMNQIIREFTGDRHNPKCKKPIFIGVSKETLEICEGETNFISYKDWYSNITLTENLRLRMMHAKALNGHVLSKISFLKDDLKSKKLTKMIDHYNLITKANTGNAVPKAIVDMFKDDAEYVKFLDQDTQLRDLIKSKYSLLDYMDGYQIKNAKTEVLWYLNNK